MVVFNLFIAVVYLLQMQLYNAQEHEKVGVYAKVTTKPCTEQESNEYIGKDYNNNTLDYKYDHLYSLIQENNKSRGDKHAIIELEDGEPRYYCTYKELLKKALCFSNVLNNANGGVPAKKYKEEQNNGTFRLLGIYGSNSANWITADLACMASGITSLVMHSKFSVPEVVDILNESKLEWLCIDLNLVKDLLSHKDKLPHLKHLILLDHFPKPPAKTNEKKRQGNNMRGGKSEEKSKEDFTEKDKEKLKELMKLKVEAKKLGLTISEFDNLTKTPPKTPPKPNTSPKFVTTIVYTSGTSGRPKGVMLTNSSVYYTIVPLSKHTVFNSFDTGNHISYLPLSHVFERVAVYLSLYLGTEIKVWSKDLSYFAHDLHASRVNGIGGVPKVFNRIYSNIMVEIEKLPKMKRFIVKKIISMRKSNHNGKFSKFLESVTHISEKIRDKVNPNLSVIVCGGGKISPTVENELCVLLDVNLYQGYGLTETSGPLFLQNSKDYSVNNLGGPVSPNTFFKLVTWETYNSKGKPPKGELLLKSEQLFAGYFLRKEETEKSFTKDGFYKTGDVVQVNPNGSLTFLDRSKGLVKLSQGEYIETEMLNNLYSELLFVNYCVVYGEDSFDGPLAIISVDKDILAKCLADDNILKKLGITEKQFLEELNDEKLNQDVYVDYVKQKMLELYKKTNLNRYNIISHVYLTCKVWDTTNYLTPTFKVRRFNVFRDFSFFIDKIREYYKSKLVSK
ncbi:acyl-CoA synthetase, putative [Plasmodium ovale]|uniref:Acyl-CoA synthetase, putative n=2 Tax=Plasmodium ovale TaxID=36330 RepID=A0A1D3JEJ2_PLAOA|nr:acyl-CoA synthetase, putative [Plasmodium ovale]